MNMRIIGYEVISINKIFIYIEDYNLYEIATVLTKYGIYYTSIDPLSLKKCDITLNDDKLNNKVYIKSLFYKLMKLDKEK